MIIDSKTHLLRIIHYPPLDGTEEPDAIRGAAHEDINLITLLVAGTEPGLQVQDIHGNWHDVSCDQDLWQLTQVICFKKFLGDIFHPPLTVL